MSSHFLRNLLDVRVRRRGSKRLSRLFILYFGFLGGLFSIINRRLILMDSLDEGQRFKSVV